MQHPYFNLLLISGLFLLFNGRPAFAQSIDLYPITIREGLQSYDPKNTNLRSSQFFKKQDEMAKLAGIDLWSHLDREIVYGVGNGNFYVLFYNRVQAPQCPKQYLIQRIRLEKKHFKDGVEIGVKNEYLVEVFKMNQFKQIKSPDEHYKRYGLQGAEARGLVLEGEIGCGEIPGVTEGNTWPYAAGKLYHKVQDYSLAPGQYNSVRFQFSRKYRLKAYFTNEDQVHVVVPDFLK